jgi:S-adenosylmethionine hydrolase
MAAIVTLTTDFGARDPWVAAMKGVILSRCPGAAIVDSTHEIGPQDVREAALFLAQAVPWFPPGTIHLVVVDPGVGTERRPLAVRAGGQRLVAPDNGCLTLLLRRLELEEARVIEAEGAVASATFHGRDIFAPAAARLACGTPLAALGPEAGDLLRIPWPEPRLETAAGGTAATGEIVHVDRFGNLVTSIDRGALGAYECTEVEIGGRRSIPFRRTYGEAAPGELLALWNSAGLLEVAVREGSAAVRLGLGRGAGVRALLRGPVTGSASPRSP